MQFSLNMCNILKRELIAWVWYKFNKVSKGWFELVLILLRREIKMNDNSNDVLLFNKVWICTIFNKVGSFLDKLQWLVVNFLYMNFSLSKIRARLNLNQALPWLYYCLSLLLRTHNTYIHTYIHLLNLQIGKIFDHSAFFHSVYLLDVDQKLHAFGIKRLIKGCLHTR